MELAKRLRRRDRRLCANDSNSRSVASDSEELTGGDLSDDLQGSETDGSEEVMQLDNNNRAGVSSENGERGEMKHRRAGRGENRSQQLNEYTLLCI